MITNFRLSVHRLHDVRFPHPRQTLLHPWPHERRCQCSSIVGSWFSWLSLLSRLWSIIYTDHQVTFTTTCHNMGFSTRTRWSSMRPRSYLALNTCTGQDKTLAIIIIITIIVIIITIIIITERDNFITQHLSRRHIVYRDLKPANILLDEHGEYQPEPKYWQPWALDLFVFLNPESHNFIGNVLLVGKLIFPIAGHVRISDLGLACDFRFVFNMPLNAYILGL